MGDFRSYAKQEIKEAAARRDFLRKKFDELVVDAIDTVTGKLAIIENAKEADIPVISSMGAGNKVNPTAFEVADIYETSICPLARVMRRECRKRGIDSLKVVYSKEIGFMFVTVDMQGYRLGSMNATLKLNGEKA